MPNPGSTSNQQGPRTGQIAILLVLVGLLLVVFVYGVSVGHFKTAAFKYVHPLIQAKTDPPQPKEQLPIAVQTNLVTSNLLNLDLTWLGVDKPLDGRGGGLGVYKTGVLVTKDALGAIWYYNNTTGDYYQLPIFMPWIDHANFPKKTTDGRNITPLRFNNIHVYEYQGKEFLVAVYGYHDKVKNCRTLRLSRAMLPENWSMKPTASVAAPELEWEHIFTAEPCLQFSGENDEVTGYQEGAALLQVGNEIYFSTGDMGQDGLGRRNPISTQSETSDFGRVFTYSIDTGEIERFASGLRNAQGLAVDVNQTIWGTDQGPMGGDEINLIESGKNYGWPYATYGANYSDLQADDRSWPHLDKLGHHEGYEPPRLVWGPSISPGSITYIQDFHPHWDGDLLVGSLLGGAVVRLTLQDGLIISQEPIVLQTRIRTALNAHGKIYLLTDNGYFGFLTPRSTDGNLSATAQNAIDTLNQYGCLECHSKVASPSLSLVFNQPIGHQATVPYTDALKQHHASNWNAENLSQFLLDPGKFSPGTSMPDQTLDSKDVETLIDALEMLSDDGT